MKFSDVVRLGGHPVGPGCAPFMVAEMSGNHNGDLGRALVLVEQAAAAGADGFKIQTFEPERMAWPGQALVSGPWLGADLVGLYRDTHVPREWHRPIFEACAHYGLVPFSTPFSPEDVHFLEEQESPALYKVASFELVDLVLLRAVAATGKPVLLSTGMATLGEIWDAVETLTTYGSGQVVLLKCTSAYPADPREANLATMRRMAGLGHAVGISDHSPGVGVAVAAVALGAVVVEKHLTLKRSDGGPDAGYSLEPEEFATLVTACRAASQALGRVHYGPTEDEMPQLALRRSLHVVADLKVGDVLTLDNVRALRPATGLLPRFLLPMVGMRVNQAVKAGTPLQWSMVG